MRDGLGQVTRISGASNAGSVDAARIANAIQRFLVEHTRLGIPAIVHEEVSRRTDGPRRDRVPPADRPGEHLVAGRR